MTTNQENAGGRIGSLFSGYGGLDLAVEAVTGAQTAWVSDVDKGACKILAHRFPDVPNIGDISKVDWSTVEPVDIVTGGFPCQDVSHAGKRAGMREGTRTGLWSYMRDAIDQLRPSLVVAENVRGLLSAEAASDVEPCPWCLGDGDGEPPMRALGAVLADLADIGYDTQWCGLRAADVGAPHGRFRVFVVAYPKGQPWRFSDGDDIAPRHTTGKRLEGSEPQWLGVSVGQRPGDLGGALIADSSGDGWDEWRTEPARQLGGPDAAERSHADPDATGVGRRTTGRHDGLRAEGLVEVSPADTDSDGRTQLGGLERVERDPDRCGRSQTAWGLYEPAIRQWERAIGRCAPAPTELSARGGQRLAPRFVEWMQGLPAGWVCDVPDLTRNEQLRALGNGVVPQQAAAALRHLLVALEQAA